jgi:hypothetical protein
VEGKGEDEESDHELSSDEVGSDDAEGADPKDFITAQYEKV